MSLSSSSTTQRKVVLITGASSGIGEATARHLASLNHKVVLGARRTDRVEVIAREIEAAGGRALALTLDVTCPDSMR
jgi:NADP-dependent 3-hydroxy acid dehydrogenase YdfG